MRDYLTAFMSGKFPPNTPREGLTKPSKPSSVSFVSAQVISIQEKTKAQEPVLTSQEADKTKIPKVRKPPRMWRQEPYYPPCVAATLADGKIQRRAADEFFAALAFDYGHEAEYVMQMLRNSSPASSSSPDYCKEVAEHAAAEIGDILTDMRFNLYVEHHLFRWEMQLNRR